jgi:GNAT superfamily N-acetyltransferase
MDAHPEQTIPSRPVTVRRATRRDLDTLLELCAGWQAAPASSDPVRLRDLLEQALSDDDATFYLAFEDQRLALGFAHITFQARPVRLGWRATIEELHARDGLEGRVERPLLEAIIDECRSRGDVIALYLLTQPDLEPRQYDFYADLGFRERGREVLIWNGSLT